MNFKIGDKVKCIDEVGHLIAGSIYTIKKIDKTHIEVEEIKDRHGYLHSRFEMYMTKGEYEFKEKEREKYVMEAKVAPIYATKICKQVDDVSKFKDTANRMCEIYKKKNKDYGNSFSEQFKEYGLISSCIRLEDKLRRIKRLKDNEQQVNDENIIDSLIDMANYAIMTVIELQK